LSDSVSTRDALILVTYTRTDFDFYTSNVRILNRFVEQGIALKGKIFATKQMSYSTPVGLFVTPILMRLKSSVHSSELDFFYLLMFPLSCIICAYMLYYYNLVRRAW